MRNPQLSIRFIKGGSIHPQLKLFSTRGRHHMVKAVQDLDKRMQSLSLHRGIGLMETKPAKIRKPLKFMI